MSITNPKALLLDQKKDYRAFYILSAIFLIIGAFGVISVLFFGNMGALSTDVPWGLWVALYVYLVWLEVGTVLAYVGLRYGAGLEQLRKLGPVVLISSLAALVGALTAIFHDLGQPLVAWRTIFAPNFGSLLTWMIWLHSIYLVILATELWFYRQNREDLVKLMTYLSVPVGLALIGVVGGLFGVVAARPLWNAMLLPVIFFISSIVAGMGLVLLLHLLFSPTYGTTAHLKIAQRLGNFFLFGILAGIFVAGWITIVQLYTAIPNSVEILTQVLFGPYSWSIWILHIVVGTAIPVLLLIWQTKMTSTLARLWSMGIAAVLMIVNFIMLPLNIVIPGLVFRYQPIQGVLIEHDYFPAVVEWLVVLFVIGFSILVFTIGHRLVCRPFFKKYMKASA